MNQAFISKTTSVVKAFGHWMMENFEQQECGIKGRSQFVATPTQAPQSQLSWSSPTVHPSTSRAPPPFVNPAKRVKSFRMKVIVADVNDTGDLDMRSEFSMLSFVFSVF